jgi:hypothetical protein
MVDGKEGFGGFAESAVEASLNSNSGLARLMGKEALQHAF